MPEGFVSPGLPSIAAHTRQAGLVNVAPTSLVFTPTVDMSLIAEYQVLTTAGANYSFVIECAYTDEGGTARVQTLVYYKLSGAADFATIANADGSVPHNGTPILIRVKGGTTVTIRAQAGGGYVDVTYNWEAQMIQVQ